MGRLTIASAIAFGLAACSKAPPPPPPDPNAWMTEAAKLSPFLPPALGPCTSTDSAHTMHLPRPGSPSEYFSERPYDCTGRTMIVAIHAGNLSTYSAEFDGRHSNFGSDSPTTYKDVMLGGGRGILMASPATSELDLMLRGKIVVTAKLDHPSPPDELVPIANTLDFKGLSVIEPGSVP